MGHKTIMSERMIFGLIFVIILITLFFFSLEDAAYFMQILTGIATTSIILLALRYGGDIHEAIKTRQLDGLKYVKDLIGTEEDSENRKWVYQELRKVSWPLAPEDEKRVRAICHDFDHIGFLCRKKLLPVELITETYHRNILDMWNRLERFIYRLREESGYENLYWEFEWLRHEADDARKRIKKASKYFDYYKRRIAQDRQS